MQIINFTRTALALLGQILSICRKKLEYLAMDGTINGVSPRMDVFFQKDFTGADGSETVMTFKFQRVKVHERSMKPPPKKREKDSERKT